MQRCSTTNLGGVPLFTIHSYSIGCPHQSIVMFQRMMIWKCPSRTSLFHHQSWSVHLFDIHSNATVCPYRSIAMFQKMMIWRCPSSTSLFSQLLSGVTRSWTIFEQHCPQYDLNVLVHWLSFFEHHCLQFTDSSFNHLSLPHSWSEYCLFFLLRVHCIAPQLLNFSRSVEERQCHLYQGFHILNRCSSMFDNLSCSGIESRISKIMSIQV